jgi:hypothetical protein
MKGFRGAFQFILPCDLLVISLGVWSGNWEVSRFFSADLSWELLMLEIASLRELDRRHGEILGLMSRFLRESRNHD